MGAGGRGTGRTRRGRQRSLLKSEVVHKTGRIVTVLVLLFVKLENIVGTDVIVCEIGENCHSTQVLGVVCKIGENCHGKNCHGTFFSPPQWTPPSPSIVSSPTSPALPALRQSRPPPSSPLPASPLGKAKRMKPNQVAPPLSRPCTPPLPLPTQVWPPPLFHTQVRLPRRLVLGCRALQ